ncbi:MAG: hypothetical protein ACRCYR_13390 [Phycicoccus sp.]
MLERVGIAELAWHDSDLFTQAFRVGVPKAKSARLCVRRRLDPARRDQTFNFGSGGAAERGNVVKTPGNGVRGVGGGPVEKVFLGQVFDLVQPIGACRLTVTASAVVLTGWVDVARLVTTGP